MMLNQAIIKTITAVKRILRDRELRTYEMGIKQGTGAGENQIPEADVYCYKAGRALTEEQIDFNKACGFLFTTIL